MTRPALPVVGNRATHKMFAFACVVVAFVIASTGGGIVDEVHGFSIAKTTTTTTTTTTAIAIRCRALQSSTSTSRAAGRKTTSREVPSSIDDDSRDDESVDDGRRRNLLVSSSSYPSIALLMARTASLSSAMAGSMLLSFPENACASGGATAGKYTTIPIAKRRYYGRVQEAVHEFLAMGPAIINGDLTDVTVQDFFDVTKTIVVEGKKKDINGVCTKKDGDCKSTTIYDSRYNDMKTSMYLLGNAFRINQTKAPENLPTVKAAKKFFKTMNKFEALVLKDPKSASAKARGMYLEALDCLDEYLDLVELPPTESGHYDKEFSTSVGESSRIT